MTNYVLISEDLEVKDELVFCEQCKCFVEKCAVALEVVINRETGDNSTCCQACFDKLISFDMESNPANWSGTYTTTN